MTNSFFIVSIVIPCCSTESLYRPFGDDHINFRHEADGFAQGCDDVAVTFQVVVGQLSVTMVFEPPFAHEIATRSKRTKWSGSPKVLKGLRSYQLVTR